MKKLLFRFIIMKKYYELLEELIMLSNQDEKDEFLNELYMIIHIANWRCENKHLDWKKQIDDKYFKNEKKFT